MSRRNKAKSRRISDGGTQWATGIADSAPAIRNQQSAIRNDKPLAHRWHAVLLAALVALVVARTLVPEDPGGQHGYGAPLDVLWLALAGAWLLVELRRGHWQLRFGWPDALVVALVGWQTASAIAAIAVGSPRPALNMLSDWVAMGTLFLLARQLVTTPSAARAVVAVMMGLACGMAAVAVHQSFVTIDADLRAYKAAKHSTEAVYELTSQWMPPDSNTRQQFEARLASRLAAATFALSNSLAGFLVPWLVVLVATIASQRGGIRIGAGCLLVTLILWGIWLTGSRTAGAAAAVGILLLAATNAREVSRRLPRRALAFLAAFAALALVAAAAVLFVTPFGRRAYDTARRSMQFRVEYWQATAAMIADHPWLGCGPGQFQDTYIAYKLPAAAEEVHDPHNGLLEVWATAGTPAAILLMALLAAVVVRAVRARCWMLDPGCSTPANAPLPASRLPPPASSTQHPAPDHDAAIVGGLAGVVLGAAVLWLFGFEPFRTHVLILAVALVGVWCVQRDWVRCGHIRPHVPLVAAAALLVNLLTAGGISYPSVADSLWLLVAIELAHCRSSLPQAADSTTDDSWSTPVTKAAGWTAGLALAAMSVASIRGQYLPVLLSRGQLRLSDQALAAGEMGSYREALRAAVAADPWSAVAASRHAAQLFADYETLSTTTQLEQFLEADRRARELAPRRSGVWAQSAQHAEAIFQATGNVEYRDDAGHYFDRAIELYPCSAARHAQAARFWHRISADERAESAATTALDLDDAIRAAGHADRQLDDALRTELQGIAGKSL